MDISKWKVLLKVAGVMNVTAAAEQLNLSQSGVSYIIKCLEQETGFPLFIRHPQGVFLTSAAQELLPVIRNFLSEKEKIEQTISQINGLSRGSIRIASYQSIGITWIPEILRQFKLDFPHIQIEVKESGDKDVEKALCNNEVDLAFTSLRERPQHEWIGLADDHLQAILPIGHRYTDEERVSLDLLKDEPFITSLSFYEHDMNYSLHMHNMQPSNVICHSQDAFAIMAMVRNGLGVSFLFRRILEAGGLHDLIVKDTDPFISRQLGIAVPSRKHATPAAKIFIEYAEDIVPMLHA